MQSLLDGGGFNKWITKEIFMSKHYKAASLAAAIALAMGSTAFAATLTTTQLPGKGDVVSGGATAVVTAATNTMDVTLTADTVIDWNKGTDLNSTGVAGFNVGSGATVNFTGAFGVLNIDSTGSASQIMGDVNAAGSVFIANNNGVIVGNGASIKSTAGGVGLIANTRGGGTFDGSAVSASIEYQGAGGDVTVAKGASLNGFTTVLVSGGGNVNVDLSALTGGAATIQAGFKNSSSTLVHDNTSAVLTATGDMGAATLAAFHSAGNASTSGTLALGSNARVDGTLTNTGALTLDATGFVIDGGLVNNKTVLQAADAFMGSLVNAGAYDGAAHSLTTTDGGITNNASIKGLSSATIKGDFTNNGQFVSTGSLDVNGGGNVVNKGQATMGGSVSINEGGNFSNEGTLTLTGNVDVTNGSVANSGKLTVNSDVYTRSNTTAGKGFTAAADYSITNTGTITAASGDLNIIANNDDFSLRSGTKNDSTGSVSNTGTLQVNAGGTLDVEAYNDVNLAGTVQAYTGTKYAALSATNSLGWLYVWAGNYDGNALDADGVATVSTDLTTGTYAWIVGNQVKLMANLSSVDSAGDAAGTIDIVGGAKADGDYAVRVAAGKTVIADAINVDGDQAGNESNVILQGTLAAQDITFGSNNAVSDVFSGPAGGLSLFNNGSDPSLTFFFTGAVKTAKYNNASNFRFNGLSVMTDGSPLALYLDPTAYTTNGTSNGLSAVNLLVNGDVNLTSPVVGTVAAGDSSVTGIVNIPNTHLVLQSSGNISTVGGFYWPGYVYLGTVLADADGNALPGTLGMGTITTGGDFSNVLPGDIAGASGIHFITQFPMSLGGDVITNANAWVNFGTALMTAKYSSEQGSTGPFFGGSAGAGTVINYDVLDESSFNTAPPSSTR